MIVLTAITGGIFIFAFIIMFLGSFGSNREDIRKRVSNILNSDVRRVNAIDEDLSKPLYERLIKPFIKSLSLKITKCMPKRLRSRNDNKKPQTDKLKKMLHQGGIGMNASEYSLIRFFVIAVMSVLSGMLAAFAGFGYGTVPVMIFGAYSGYSIVRFNLTYKISERRKSMEEQMPDVLDLLSVNVEAGLGFEQALLQVVDHFEGPLIDELTITYREMSMGRTKRDALALFAERCGIDEIKTFVGSIIQAEQLGISIKNVLRTQAAAMRKSRRSKVEEKAQKVQIKMLIPMVGLIFPVLLIVLMGPATVQIIRELM